MTTGKGRLTPQQLRILAVAWIGVVMLVGACTFLAIFFGARMDRSYAEIADSPTRSAVQNTTPTPTSALSPGDIAATQAANTGATPLPAPTIPPRQDPSFGYGIQVQAHMNTEQTLDQVQQLGLGWIKQQVRWSDLEPQRGQPNWDALDAIFAATSRRNIRVMVGILNAPDWARSVTAPGKAGPPDNVQDYVNYVSQFTQRYKGAVHAIELWNEQNLEREWYTAGGLSATGYMNLLRPAAEAIRAIDPGVIVISGALAPTGVNDGVIAYDDFIYMQAMIDKGLLDVVDCVGAHANGYNVPPNIAYDAGFNDASASFRGPFDNPHHSWSFYSTLRGYRDLIVAGGGDTPLCVTEFGWASVEGMNGQAKQSFEFAYDNTLQEQANNITQAFQLMHDWDFVWLAFLFNLDFSPKAGGNPQDDTTMFSILTGEGAPRPAFDAVRSMPKPP